jgi:hypothetical protein
MANIKQFKSIEIEITTKVHEFVTFKITKQTHYNDKFGLYNNVYTASDGFELRSDSYPEELINGMYVRGYDINKYNVLVTVDESKFLRFLNAIKEYNNCFGYRNFLINEDGSFKVVK